MENPFASLVDETEQMVVESIELLELEDTTQNRYALANQLYEALKGKDGGVGDDRPFHESMTLIALSTLQMRYSRESILQHLDN